MPDARSKNRTVSEVRGDLELVITRTIDGPPRIVFDAWTRLDLLVRWWAPSRAGVPGEGFALDLRPGGKWRSVLKLHTGDELAFSGTYLEVVPPSRLVYTSVFEPRPEAGEVMCTVTFEDRDAKTLVTLREVFPSRAALEAALRSGMDESLDQLDDLIASLG